MSSLEQRSTHQYDQWIATPPQAHETCSESSVAALRLARHESLRASLAPLKQSAHDAVTKLHEHLQSINKALEEFLDTRGRRSELLSRFSSLFNDLRLPPELATKTSQALLKEYMQLSRTTQSSEVSLGDAVLCLSALRQDLQELLKDELGDFLQTCERHRRDLLTLVQTTEPLTSLEQLIDTKATPAGQLLTTLRDSLLTLTTTISEMRLDAPLPDEIPRSLRETQDTFAAIVEASSPYAPPYGKISSNHLVLAELRRSIRTSYSQLPKLKLEEAAQSACNLPTLTSDEKRAFLVVTRHIDTTTSNSTNQPDEATQAIRSEYQQLIDHFASLSVASSPESRSTSSSGATSQEEFRNTAERERDELINDIICHLEIPRAKALILCQAEALSSQYPDLMTSINSILNEVTARFEDKLLKIECEVGIAGDIAQYLGRQRINVIDLHPVSILFKENPDLEVCCANILSNHQSIPSGSIDELRSYLVSLADTLSAAKNLSPLLSESLLDAPGQELATLRGIESKNAELVALSQSPDKLRALEISLLTALLASLLERNFPVSDHGSAQYTVAAQIVLLGLAPIAKNGSVERPVRTCSDVMKLVNRTTGGRLSLEIVHQTIQDHLIPHLVVCKKQSKRNPSQHEFQLSSHPAEQLEPIISHLNHLTLRAQIPAKRSPSAQPGRKVNTASTEEQQGTPPHRKNQAATVVARPSDSDYEMRTAQRATLEKLAACIEEKSKQLDEHCAITPATTTQAAELSSVFSRMDVLALRLSSSLKNNMERNAMTSLYNSFDSRCFNTLRTLAGIAPIASGASPRRSKRKDFDSKRINTIIYDCLLEEYPFAKESLERSKSLVTTLRDIEREISSRGALLPFESTEKTLSALRSAQANHSKLKPEGAATLGVLCSWIGDTELREGTARSLAVLSKDIRAKISELTDAPPASVTSVDAPQLGETDRRSAHE